MTTAFRRANGSQLQIVRFTVLGGLSACFALAPRLWLDHPFFGCVPVIEGLPALSGWVAWTLVAVILGLLIPVLVSRAPRGWILLWCAVFACRCAYDRITWQPFFFQ